VATLTMMEQRGTSDRHLAATLAMVMAMAQANVVFPMTAMGLHFLTVLGFSCLGGLVAAGATYYGFGRGLNPDEMPLDETLQHPVADSTKGTLDVINRAGAEAFRIAIGAIPLLVLSLVVVTALRAVGTIGLLTRVLGPTLTTLHLDPAMILPTLTKYLGGGTAMMGVVDEMQRQGQTTAAMVNRTAGFLIHPLDVPGVAVLISAGRRVTSVWKPAVLGALAGILVRTIGHALVS
jgi:spore maturation protein SpmB